MEETAQNKLSPQNKSVAQCVCVCVCVCFAILSEV